MTQFDEKADRPSALDFLNKDRKFITQSGFINQRRIASDHPGIFQPARHWRRAQADTFGQFIDRNASILLQACRMLAS